MQTRYASQRNVIDYFESTAAYWKEIYSDDRLLPVIYRDRQKTALDWIWELDLAPKARVLEVGCGAGLISIKDGRCIKYDRFKYDCRRTGSVINSCPILSVMAAFNSASVGGSIKLWTFIF